ncbi:hypothetical protein CS062_20445 [Roseateles chitinivorans]|uniref:DUF1444 family protein n=1 Tax=Roseateles chitinivorans TaxID=2917965 RepID=A0A2G9C4N3_9BURK|nr:hypothetical protein CS062_20445 [Roseateles chitinivorans]
MREWIRWQFGRPTVADVLKRLVRRLDDAGATAITVNEDPPQVRFTLNGGQMHSNLTHLMRDLLRANGRRAREVEFDRYLEGTILRPMSADAPEHSEDYASVRAHLLPLLRTRADMAISALDLANAAGQVQPVLTRASNETPFRHIVGDYVAILGLDAPESTARVGQGMLDKWGVSFDTAFDDALDNLRGLPEDLGWQQIAPGLWQGAWNDSYEPSRLLLPDLIYRSGVAHPVAMVPLRHVLLVADENDIAGLALMAAMCKQLRQEHSRWLSFRPLRLVERTWLPFEAPEPLRQMFQELISVEDSEDYSAQKRLLEQRGPQDASAPFVGSAQLVQFKDSERVVSYSVWSDGVDTLLPHTDLVAFASLDQPDQSMIVSWADAVRIAGHYMQPVDGLHPPRMRVNIFPNADEQAQLNAVKVL